MDLTGSQKAVLMLLTLDESVATPIIAELDPDELRKLREVASTMKGVPTNQLEGVYAEFIEGVQDAVAVPRGGVRYLRRITTRALGEARSDAIFQDAPQTALDRLANADPAQLASLLESEHPQLAAAIISQLEPERAARTLENMPETVLPAVLSRLGSMTEVPSSLLEEAAAALAAELPQAGAEVPVLVDGLNRTAAVVRKMDKKRSEVVLGALEAEFGDLARDIRRSMYTFEDLLAVDARGMRELLEAVPVERLTVALKAASEQLVAHVFSSMSKRAGERIKEDMEILGNPRLADVESAQREIMEIAMRLNSEGTISLEKQ